MVLSGSETNRAGPTLVGRRPRPPDNYAVQFLHGPGANSDDIEDAETHELKAGDVYVIGVEVPEGRRTEWAGGQLRRNPGARRGGPWTPWTSIGRQPRAEQEDSDDARGAEPDPFLTSMWNVPLLGESDLYPPASVRSVARFFASCTVIVPSYPRASDGWSSRMLRSIGRTQSAHESRPPMRLAAPPQEVARPRRDGGRTASGVPIRRAHTLFALASRSAQPSMSTSNGSASSSMPPETIRS